MPNIIPVTRAVHKNILVCYFLLLGGFRDGLERRVFLSSFFCISKMLLTKLVLINLQPKNI